MARMQEEQARPSYNGKVFRRLFAYLRPHVPVVVICLLLVLATTTMDLWRPILIGGAIDRFIEDYAGPYAYTAPEDANVRWDGLYLRKGAIPEGGLGAVMVYYGEEYYLVRDLMAEETEGLMEAAREMPENAAEGEVLFIRAAGKTYRGEKLDREALSSLRQSDFEGVGRVALIYSLVLLATVACSLTRTWLLMKLGQDVIFTIRRDVFEHILSLPARWFDTNPTGRIVTRVTNDVEALSEMYTGVLIRLFSNTVLILGYMIMMLVHSWRLALLCFAFLPVIVGLTAWFRTLARRIYRVVRTKVSELNTFLSENISGMRLIQSFAREKAKAQEFEERTGDLYRANLKEIKIMAVFRPAIHFVSSLAIAALVWRSGAGVLAGSLSLGTMYIFINYIRSFFDPIEEMAEHFSVLQNALASGEKIFSVMDEKNPIREAEHPVSLESIRGEIEFRHVWFAYDGEDYVLQDLSFHIRPGEKVAFVGATGAGKSSILNLIGRYYEIQKGQILIDGVDIRDIELSRLRRAIGQVQQDVFIFTGDIEGNIRLLDDSISYAEVCAAARAVNADRFIERLPKRYHEPVMERGATLSAGQRQLLSFARTLAYKPTILVMDEATANIDTETEQLIQGALETLMEGRTTIMVAHRLSTIQHADNIMVMHRGRLRESGTHQQLLEKGGIYKKLYELQQ